MPDCLFCKIAKKEIPSSLVFENDEAVAFLDIKPVNPGHVLIVPKAHFVSMLETPADLFGRLMSLAPALSKALMQATGATGVNVGVNTGRAAGQVVDHVHIHLMPRHDNDGYDLWHGKPYANIDEINKLAEAIRRNVSK